MRLESFEGGRAVIDARGEQRRARAAVRRGLQRRQHRGRLAAAPRSASSRRARSRSRFSSLRGEVVELAGGVTVVNDCYNANPMSMRAALDHLAASPAGAADRGARRHGRAGRRRGRASTARSAHLARRARASTCWSRSASWRCPYAEAFGGDLHQVGDAEEAGALLEEIARPATACCEGLALGRPGEGRSALAMLGEILIARHGLAAHLHLPRARSSSTFLREREFGQHIREEGPEGHHEKAGTPTMGGLLILLVDRGAVPDPQRVPRGQPGRARHRARVRRARLRRRLDEDRPAPLARPVRPAQADRAGRDRDRAVARRHRVRRTCRRSCASARSTRRSTSACSTRC